MKRRTRTARTVVIASAVAATISLAMATAGCTDGGPAPKASPSATRTSAAPSADPIELASRHFAVLARPATSADALPDDDAFEPEEIVPDSQRFVVEQDGTRYWIAATTSGGVCLIARNGDPNSAGNWAVSAGRTVEPATVVTSMIDDAGHQTALVSDGYTATDPSGLHELAANVWTGNIDPNLREDVSDG